MKSNTLKLSIVIALSLATLAACDKGKKTEAVVADTNTPAAAAPAAIAPAPTAPVAAAPVAAATGGEVADAKKAWRAPCADDLKKFCADADKPRKCLKEHKAQLSQACSAGLEAARAAQKAEKGE